MLMWRTSFSIRLGRDRMRRSILEIKIHSEFKWKLNNTEFQHLLKIVLQTNYIQYNVKIEDVMLLEKT